MTRHLELVKQTEMPSGVSRREFLRKAGRVAGAATVIAATSGTVGFLLGRERSEAEQGGPGVITNVHGQDITIDGRTVWSEAHRTHDHRPHVNEGTPGLTAWSSGSGPTIVTDSSDRVVGVAAFEGQLTEHARNFAQGLFGAQAADGLPLDSLNDRAGLPEGSHGTDGTTAVWSVDDLSGANPSIYVFLAEKVSAQAPNVLGWGSLPQVQSPAPAPHHS